MTKRKCKNHPDENVVLICFTCNTQFLCLECVVDGVHKYHNILNPNKLSTVYVLRDQIETLQERIKLENEQIQSAKNRGNKRKKAMRTGFDRTKEKMR